MEEAGRQAGARGLVTCTTAVNGDNDDDDDAVRGTGNAFERMDWSKRGQNACENAYITFQVRGERRESGERERKRERE